MLAGKVLACGGSTGSVVIVGVETGARLKPLDHESPVQLVRFSSSSRFVLTASDTQAKFWDLKRTGAVSAPRFTFDLPATPVDASFDVSQSRLALTASDGTVYLWDLTLDASEAPLAVEGGAGFVAAQFFASGHPQAEPLLVTAERFGIVRVWDLGPSPRRQKRPPSYSEEERAAVATQLGEAREEGDWLAQWEAPPSAHHTGRSDVVLATCCPFNGSPASATSTPQDRAALPPGAQRVSPLERMGPLLVVSAAGDGVAHVLDVRARAHLITFDLGTAITAVAFSPRGSRLLVGDVDGAVTVLETESGEALVTVECHRDSVTAIHVAPLSGSAGAVPASTSGRSSRGHTSRPVLAESSAGKVPSLAPQPAVAPLVATDAASALNRADPDLAMAAEGTSLRAAGAADLKAGATEHAGTKLERLPQQVAASLPTSSESRRKPRLPMPLPPPAASTSTTPSKSQDESSPRPAATSREDAERHRPEAASHEDAATALPGPPSASLRPQVSHADDSVLAAAAAPSPVDPPRPPGSVAASRPPEDAPSSFQDSSVEPAPPAVRQLPPVSSIEASHRPALREGQVLVSSPRRAATAPADGAEAQAGPRALGSAHTPLQRAAISETAAASAAEPLPVPPPVVTHEVVEAAVEAAVASRLDGLVASVRKAHMEVIRQGHATREALAAQIGVQAAEIKHLREQVAQLQASLSVTSAY